MNTTEIAKAIAPLVRLVRAEEHKVAKTLFARSTARAIKEAHDSANARVIEGRKDDTATIRNLQRKLATMEQQRNKWHEAASRYRKQLLEKNK